MELSSMFKDVASIIAEKCVNPNTQRPYTISMIERALKDVHFSVDPKRGAKQQALHVCAPGPHNACTLSTAALVIPRITGWKWIWKAISLALWISW